MGEEPLSKDDVKEALKAAHKEWLDEHFAAFGRWTAMAIMGLLFMAFINFLIWLRQPSGGIGGQGSSQVHIEGSR